MSTDGNPAMHTKKNARVARLVSDTSLPLKGPADASEPVIPPAGPVRRAQPKTDTAAQGAGRGSA